MENWRYMMFSIKKIAWLLAMAPLPLFAQQPVLSLDTILKRIENNNLLLQTYALKAEGLKHRAEAGRAWMAPMVGVGTFMTPYPGQQVMDPGDKGALMLQLEQEIPNPGKLKAKKRYDDSKAAVEMAGKGVALNAYRAQAKSLYMTWLLAQERIKVLQRNDQIMQMMKKIEQVRYPYNQGQLSGVYRATAKLEENQNMIRMQQGDMGRAKAWLNSLMNLPADHHFTIDSSWTMSFVPAVSLDTALLAAQRKDIVQMDQNIQSMKLGISAMKAESRPGFKVRFDHMSPLSKMMPKAYSVMGMISIPIAPWSAKMYKSEALAMGYEVEAMEKQRAGMLQESQGMLTGMQYEIQSMQKRIAAMEEKIIPALKRTLDADFLNYQENKLQLQAVMSSWEALTMMQLNVLDEKVKLYQMIIDYEKELYR